MAPPAGARCGKHVDVAAVDVCQRCGTFVCSGCIEIRNEDVFCSDCVKVLDQPPTRRIRAVFWLSAGWLFVVIGAVVAALTQVAASIAGLVALATPFFAGVMGGLWIAELVAQRRGEAPRSGRSRLVWSAFFISLELLISAAELALFVLFALRQHQG